MRVLGIHVGHDSSAALVVDGRIVADAAEERFRRIKHCAGFPTRAIAWCLKGAGESGSAIDAIALSTSRAVPQLNQWLGSSPGAAGGFSAGGLPLYLRPSGVSAKTPVFQVPHHRAHAASAYYTSGYEGKQLIVTLDGVGDGRSTCLWRGEGGRIEPLLELGETASLGWFYGCVTEALGWWHGDGEGKTMGLAAFGDSSRGRGCLQDFHPSFSNGELSRPHVFGRPAGWAEGGALHWHLRESEGIARLIEKHGRAGIAAEAQSVLEEQVCELVLPWLAREGVGAIACAGGVFLNVKLNQRLWDSGRLTRQHVFPNAGDAGLAAGAALSVHFQESPRPEIPALEHMFLGPEYTDDEIERSLRTRRLTYQRTHDPAGEAARLLAGGRIVGWFQGRMESGPRALGHRSILMSPADPGNRDILNSRVKFRESFRPYCPSLLESHREIYLENSRDEPFMTTSFRASPAAVSRAPSAVHVDGTMRPQIVRPEASPRFGRLLQQFGNLTGDPLLINTSFNLAGEPLVNTPSDALRAYFDSGLDALVMGTFLLSKEEGRDA